MSNEVEYKFAAGDVVEIDTEATEAAGGVIDGQDIIGKPITILQRGENLREAFAEELRSRGKHEDADGLPPNLLLAIMSGIPASIASQPWYNFDGGDGDIVGLPEVMFKHYEEGSSNE